VEITMKKRHLLEIVLFLIGLSILVIFITQLGIEDVLAQVRGANLSFIGLAVVFMGLLMIVSAYRYYLISKALGMKIKFRKLLYFYMFESLLINFSPGNMGQFITPIFFWRYIGIPAGLATSMIVFTGIIILLVSVTIMLLSIARVILTVGLPGEMLLPLLIYLGVMTALAILLIRSYSFLGKRVKKEEGKRGRLEKLITRAYPHFKLFAKSKHYYKKRLLGYLSVLTILHYLAQLTAFYLGVNSIMSADFFDAVSAYLIGFALRLISFIPGGIGVADIGTSGIFSLLGYPFIESASASIVGIFVINLCFAVFGIFGFIKLKRTKVNVKHEITINREI
jgi:uncharacterized protein (TIRG00374 family)